MHTAALLRRPAWERRASVVLLPSILLATFGLGRYLHGGGRLDRSGFPVSGPVSIGEEFHVGAPLGASGGEIEVLTVRPIGVTGPVVVDVRVVLESAKIPLGFRGPLPSDVAVLPLPSPGNALKVNTGGVHTIYSLDLRMIPTAAGVSRVEGIEVTYRAGVLRQRTARFSGTCITAFTDWRNHLDDVERDCNRVGL
jgi:hypothetical protein